MSFVFTVFPFTYNITSADAVCGCYNRLSPFITVRPPPSPSPDERGGLTNIPEIYESVIRRQEFFPPLHQRIISLTTSCCIVVLSRGKLASLRVCSLENFPEIQQIPEGFFFPRSEHEEKGKTYIIITKF